MKTIATLPSGHRLTLNLAPIEEAQDLLNVLAATLAAMRIEITDDFVKAILSGDPATARAAIAGKDVAFLWTLLMTALASRPLQDRALHCAQYCALNLGVADEKCDRALFNAHPEARRDFLPALLEVLKANLRPFFEDLVSGWLRSAAQQAPSRK